MNTINHEELMAVEGGTPSPAAACPLLTPLGCGIAVAVTVGALVYVWATE